MKPRITFWLIALIALSLVAITPSFISSASPEPRPGMWSGSPELSFEVTTDRNIANVVYTQMNIPLSGKPCKVCILSCPVKDSRADCQYGEMELTVDGKKQIKKPALYLTGEFESETTFKGEAGSMGCQVPNCESGAAMGGFTLVPRTLDAHWISGK